MNKQNPIDTNHLHLQINPTEVLDIIYHKYDYDFRQYSEAHTAQVMNEDKKKCIDAGTNDYIMKLIDIDQLLSLMYA